MKVKGILEPKDCMHPLGFRPYEVERLHNDNSLRVVVEVPQTFYCPKCLVVVDREGSEKTKFGPGT